MPALERYLKLFDEFESALSQSEWLAGQCFSLADLSYAPYLARLRQLGFDALFERYPRISKWSDRVAGRPSVVEGVERWFNPKYLALFTEKRPEATAWICRLLE
jgi:glutathione S-transferase